MALLTALLVLQSSLYKIFGIGTQEVEDNIGALENIYKSTRVF